jgi:membrane-bound lytic murein transglycosylase B
VGAVGSDGNDDGIVDPQSIDDAALSAGCDPCAGGADLTDPSVWIVAYNDTVEHHNLVADAATRYATG